MAAVTQLVLLLCLCGTLADTIPAAESTGGDVRAELKQLRDMVMEQKQELKDTKAALDTQRTLADDLRRENSAVGAMAVRVERLEKENEMLKAAIEVEKEEKAAEMTSGVPKVAFEVALDCCNMYGPFDTVTKIIFTLVYTNVGNAYNTNTGTFTAPVRGVYYFRFSGIDDRANRWMGVFLFKNGHDIKYKQLENGDGHLNLSFTVIRQLERGDVIDVRIFPETRFAPPSRGDINLSGFLMFPL